MIKLYGLLSTEEAIQRPGGEHFDPRAPIPQLQAVESCPVVELHQIILAKNLHLHTHLSAVVMAARTKMLDLKSESLIHSLNTSYPCSEPNTVLGTGIQHEQDKVIFS